MDVVWILTTRSTQELLSLSLSWGMDEKSSAPEERHRHTDCAIYDHGDIMRVHAKCQPLFHVISVGATPQMWKSCPARELNPRSSAIAAGALTTELLSWDSH